MLLRDRKAERVGELVGDHVNFPAIDLHAACERISKKKKGGQRGRILRMDRTIVSRLLGGETFTGISGSYLS